MMKGRHTAWRTTPHHGIGGVGCVCTTTVRIVLTAYKTNNAHAVSADRFRILIFHQQE